MSYTPKILGCGDLMKVVTPEGHCEEIAVSRVQGQFIHLQYHRFHYLDDRVDAPSHHPATWRTPDGITYELLPSKVPDQSSLF